MGPAAVLVESGVLPDAARRAPAMVETLTRWVRIMCGSALEEMCCKRQKALSVV